MELSKNGMDMLHGGLAKKLLLFTLPIARSSMMQQLFSAADTVVVGLFGRPGALAAVGTNTEIVALIVTVSSGLSIGANVLIANRIGKNQTDDLPAALRSVLALALVIGGLGAALGQLAVLPLLRLIRTPDDIFSGAALYLRIYLLGYPFLLLYDFGAAALRARGDSRSPFFALMLSGIANVVLNVLFVTALRLDVAGVAIATGVSNALSAALVLRRLHCIGMLKRAGRGRWAYIAETLKTGVPSAIQGAVFCFANTFVQASVNRFGSVAIAGSAIAMNFEYLSYYGITAFGQTATTFTSQNYAAGQLDRCRKILWLCLGFSVLGSLVMIVPAVVFRDFFCGLFSGDPAEIECACVRILCILFFEPVCSLYEIPAGVLRGTGRAVLPAADMMVGTCAFRIVWIMMVFRAHPSPEALFHAFPLSWLATIALVALTFALCRPLKPRAEA